MTYEEARAAVRTNPDDTEAWFVLGTLEEAAGHTAQASAAFRRVLVLDPYMQDALAALTLLQEERVLESARASLLKSSSTEVSLNPQPTRTAHTRWPLFALLLLCIGVVALLYLNFRGADVTSSDPATDAIDATTPTPTVSTPLPTARAAIRRSTSMAPIPLVTGTITPLTALGAYKQMILPIWGVLHGVYPLARLSPLLSTLVGQGRSTTTNHSF